MKVDKLIKKIVNNYSVLFVVLGAIGLLYFLKEYSYGKGISTEGAADANESPPRAFSDTRRGVPVQSSPTVAIYQ